MDFFPIALSLQVSAYATALAIAIGVPLAWLLARRRFPGRDLLEAAVVLPMLFPPSAWRSPLAGGILTFCRALGDFGITLMVAGSIPGKTQTMSLAIYDHVQANQLAAAHTLGPGAGGLVLL